MKTIPIAAALLALAAISTPALAEGNQSHSARNEHKAQQAQPRAQKSNGRTERQANHARTEHRREPSHERRQPEDRRAAPPHGRNDAQRNDYRGGRPPRREGYPAPRGYRDSWHHRHPVKPRPYYNPYAWRPPRYFREPRYSVYFAYDLVWDEFGLNVERAIYDHGQWVLFGFSAFHGPLRVIVDSASGILLSYHPYHRHH